MTEISVVIPTKDRLPYLRKTVPMFLAQPGVKEVIVIVDGCSDGTLEYIQAASESDPRVRYADNVTNKGTAYSRNRGLELAQCEYLFTGEDDLELSENFFATLLAHMAETGADVISGRTVFRGERESRAAALARTDRLSGPSVNRRTLMVHQGMKIARDQEQSLLPSPMLGRTDVFRKVRWDDWYRGNAWREESDFQLSAREAGYKLVCCPHAISFNIEIENDRGGAHATRGLKRLGWQIRNNWYFIQKHREIIAKEFNAGNLYVYIAKFATQRLSGLVFGILIDWKQQVFGAPRSAAKLFLGFFLM